MKKLLTLTLLLALCLTACAVPDEEAPPLESSTVHAATPEGPEVRTLTGTGQTGEPEEHTLSGGGNVIEHEPAGYCGNTVTTVTGPDGEECSFCGDDSIALTDLLLYLDYSEGVCRCLPEYTVDTEFGKSYGVNLSEGYARYEGSQTPLTAEQVELIQGIVSRQAGGAAPETP